MSSITEIKISLHDYISGTDDIDTLTKVQAYVNELLDNKNNIIAYTAQGEPLTHAAYKKEIDKTIAEVDKGEVLSQEEMEKRL